MNTTLLPATVLFLIALGFIAGLTLRLPTIAAWLMLEDKAEKGFVLGGRLGSTLGFALGSVLSSMPGGMLGIALGSLQGVVLGVMLGGVLGGVLGSKWGVLRKRPIKTLEAPDNDRPPQFAEYLLYFLPKTMREPLLGDLEEEYLEVYTRFGKRKATIWYYVQVLLSYWPLLCRASRKLVKWGVLGWVGGAVRRLIS